MLNVRRPTSGRILRYTYGPDDHAIMPGASRPCIVVDAYGDPTDPKGELFAVVVFTAGLRDFTKGRPGWDGHLAKLDVRLGPSLKPGFISWPPDVPR